MHFPNAIVSRICYQKMAARIHRNAARMVESATIGEEIFQPRGLALTQVAV